METEKILGYCTVGAKKILESAVRGQYAEIHRRFLPIAAHGNALG